MQEALTIEMIYFYGLLASAFLSLFVVLIGDVISIDGPIDPLLIVPWISFVCGFGYIGEQMTNSSSLVVFMISIVLSTVVVFLLNFYVIVPIRHADSSISTSEKKLEGRTAIVSVPIPQKGMGEITIRNVTGTISRPASLYHQEKTAIEAGSQVLIIEIKNRVCYVVNYEG